jgi:Zn-dependent protease with chaperone function/competence protein ComGC
MRMNSQLPPITAPWPNALSVKKEGQYFVPVLVISVLVWALIAISIIGLIYGALFAFLFWIANGLLVAHLRSEAVRVSERQMPALHAAFLDVCARLGLQQPPALYLLQSGGALNAFATRHSGRNFVVVYSDLIDALGADTPEMRFVLGHEIGHIKSRHLAKQIALAPGMFFPLIGPAYRRSWESSCDLHGAFATNNPEASMRAMLALAGGKEAGRTLDPREFAAQNRAERGFFISLHELTSTYPTLSRRTADLEALSTGASYPSPPRHPMAFFLALFMPGGGAGAAQSMMITVILIGLLAAMAIPAFNKVRENSQMIVCKNNHRMLVGAFEQYTLENGSQPGRLEDFIGPGKMLESTPACVAGGTYDYSVDDDKHLVVTCSIHGTIADMDARMPRRP